MLFHNYDFAGRPLVSGLGTATFTTLNPDASPTSLETTNTNWHTVRKYDAKPTNVYPWSSFWTQISPLTLSNVAGRLAAVASRSNGAWQVTLYSYDTHGGIAATRTFTQNDAGSIVLTALNTTTLYQRDLRGEITKRSTTVGSSSFYHWYEYDNRGQLEKVFASTSSTKPGSPDVTYTYGADGSPVTRQFAGDASIPFKYTIKGQLRSISSLTSGTTPFAAQYAWKRNGTIDTVEFRSNGSPHTNKRYRYVASYDGKNQLTAAQYAYHNGSSYASSNAYRLNGIAYDLSGNLSALTRYRESASIIDNLSYTTAGSSNRLNSIADAIGSTTEDWDVQTGSFTYDASGNMKTAPAPYGITAMTYDHANLPVSITGNGVTSTYRYNAQSQRIAKKVGSGSTDIYVLEGPTTLGVFSVNGAGSVTGSHFNVLAGAKVIGRLPSGGDKRFYHTDMLGSTRAAVENGSIVESYDYDPWGVLMAGRTLDGPTRERFTGKERDETGLDYFGFRYYMSSVGRWTTADPLASEFPSWNSYNYVENSPVAMTDPVGLWPSPCPPCDEGGTPSDADEQDKWNPDWGALAEQWIQDRIEDLLKLLAKGNAVLNPVAPLVAGALGRDPATGEEVGAVASVTMVTLGVLDFADGPSPTSTLPRALTLGRNADEGISVYYGVLNGSSIYCGITCNLAQRASQHGDRFSELVPLNRTPLTRGEARAVEQALIVRNGSSFVNVRNSISPAHTWYQQAVDWGEMWLRANKF